MLMPARCLRYPSGLHDTFIVVIGGRGRFPKEDIPESFLVGHSNDGVPREVSTLMNDVWTMDSGFGTWKMQNPGCYVHHENFTTFPLLEVSYRESRRGTHWIC